MSDLRETYELPKRSPMPFRQWWLMLAVPVIALALWFVLPDSPITVALLVIVVLGVVFFGVQRILHSRQLTEAPDARPVPRAGRGEMPAAGTPSVASPSHDESAPMAPPHDDRHAEPLGPATPDSETPLGDTPEAHDEMTPHDLPLDNPGRPAAEREAERHGGTFRGETR